MNTDVFERIRHIVYDASGIRLGDGKMSMVSSRLAKRLRALNLEDELQYLGYLEQRIDEEIVQLLDVISTNVTSFFREKHQWDLVRDALDRWMTQGQKRFRFWSSACSTGQEPYSLAMTVSDMISKAEKAIDARILATDISTRVLADAQAGVYPEEQIDTIPKKLRLRFFQRMAGAESNQFQVSADLKKILLFRRLNLSSPPFPMTGPMDVLLCRNVMIYFDEPVRQGLYHEFDRLLKPGGLLLLGHAESLPRQTERSYERVGHAAYKKRG